MAWVKMQSLFASDDGMDKKDDDHPPATLARRSGIWSPARIPPRRSVKRLLLLAVVAAGVYFFISNIPTDLGIRDHRRPTYIYPDDDKELPGSPPTKLRVLPKRKLSATRQDDDGTTREAKSNRSYNGPVRFLELAPTLHAVSYTKGGSNVNKNILFAASSLKSAALLLPLACEMGLELKNYVHFALMSRSEIGLDELQEINGIDYSCHIIFHGMAILLPPSWTAAADTTRQMPVPTTQRYPQMCVLKMPCLVPCVCVIPSHTTCTVLTKRSPSPQVHAPTGHNCGWLWHGGDVLRRSRVGTVEGLTDPLDRNPSKWGYEAVLLAPARQRCPV